ncbi:MAG: 5-formyltetrahydrofolate cyclo-ligase [Clostridia bacterium]|nr:5-formyltetrahydrofolate cyclo-ligase [Clostridia bacterium]
MNKAQLRQQYKALRHAIPQKAAKSLEICRAVERLPNWRTATVVALYASLPDEVDTAPLIAAALRAGKTVCLPKVEGNEIAFYRIGEATQFHSGAYSIREPQSEVRIEKSDIELIIVPLLAADSQNYRLGFGGGYYDRYLQDFTGTTLGICFGEQLSPTPLPHEAHDVPLENIITQQS